MTDSTSSAVGGGLFQHLRVRLVVRGNRHLAPPYYLCLSCCSFSSTGL